MRLNDEQRKLVEENIGLAKSRALYWFNRIGFYELDELISLCMLGLVKAGYYFNESKGAAFSSLAYRIIDNQIKKEIRDRNALKRSGVEIPFSYMENGTEANLDDFSAVLSFEDKYGFISKDYADFLLKRIPLKQRVIFEEVFYFGKTQQEAAKKLGMSQRTVNYHLQQAKKTVGELVGV